jgi:PAT family beta-lactamase induction signal transducer AmpG
VSSPAARTSSTGFAALVSALRSRRTAVVALQSFASGLPLGIVWNAIPDWMRDIGVDLRVVGLLTLAQAPWTFKVLWAPLVDRYTPPFWGRRRGWMALTQVALFALGLLLAGVGERPEAIWVVGAIALAMGIASATQDIAIDAYAVEALHKDEQGAAAGVRTAFYRAALLLAGGASISLAARIGWPTVNALMACVYLPLLFVTWYSPEPELTAPPPRTLRDAVWQPFSSFFTRPRALEILAFVVLYKFSDQLTQSLTRPFLIDMGYGADQRGLALATIGVFGLVIGALIGGWGTTVMGLGHSLWAFGFLQLFSNFGYYVLAILGGPSAPVMYAATGIENLTSGMGTGAFSVLLLRLTERRFSATQYALFSSLLALPRMAAGPITGFTVTAVGWPTFYIIATVVGIPGLMMLARFVPIGVREPVLDTGEGGETSAPPPGGLAVPSLAAGAALLVAAVLVVAGLDAMQGMRTNPGAGFGYGPAVMRLLAPSSLGEWVTSAGLLSFAAVGGVAVAASRGRRAQARP